MLRNTSTSFGFISQLLHGSMAVLLALLFSVGLYMTSLGYYDPLYHSLPWWHKSLGLLTMILLFIRIIWVLSNPHPDHLKTHKQWEQNLAHVIQKIFYVLIFCIGLSGYFIATAKGKGIEFFNLFQVAAITNKIPEDYADLIGSTHEIMAIALSVFVLLHILGALKHHFIDKDGTLKRMFGKN